jgi:hypothetical protein
MSDYRVQTWLECRHANTLGHLQCEACGIRFRQTEKARKLARRQLVKSLACPRSVQPMSRQFAKAGDALVHVLIGLAVIAVAAISYFAGCRIVWIGGFIWGAIETVRGLAMLVGAGGGGLP